MLSIYQFITEGGGQPPGKIEIKKTSLKQAREYARSEFKKNGMILEEELPDFDTNYIMAKKWASKGWTKRKDMPVISTKDVKLLQQRLKSGRIDINPPYADDSEPFPNGLSGEQAKKWLDKGLRDGDLEDDIIHVSRFSEPTKNISPIQEQIYLDKAIEAIVNYRADGIRNFMEKVSHSVISADLYLIDGHHRHLSTMLVDPTIQVKGIMVDLPIKKLLEMTLSYGDAIGNKRNN